MADGSVNPVDQLQPLAHGAVGWMIAAGIIVAIADTRFYPVAVAMVVTAGIYVVTEKGGANVAASLSNLMRGKW